MENLMFWGMILISSLVIGMSIYILIVQAYLNKAMIDKFNEQKISENTHEKSISLLSLKKKSNGLKLLKKQLKCRSYQT